MRFVVYAAHVALILAASFPMYEGPGGWPPDPPPSPLAQALGLGFGGLYRSVLAAGVPPLLALANLFRLLRPSAPARLWLPLSTLLLGLFGMAAYAVLGVRCGWGARWGVEAAFAVSSAPALTGVAAWRNPGGAGRVASS
jgi:hypothetical protein